MKRVAEFALIMSMTLLAFGRASSQAVHVSGANADSTATSRSSVSKGQVRMPPLPSGNSTILGGAIADVDPVLDRFTLRIVGEKPMRILYDERTQVFLNGDRIPLNQLRSSEHASVQTTLDGTSVFAISVHILSQLHQGDYRGEITSFDPSTGDLELVSGKGGASVRIRVTSDTKIERTGQSSISSTESGPADLQRGTLVAIQFDPDGKGRGLATHIALLATPGARLVFSGNLIALDMRAGSMMLLDRRDNRSYRLAFDPGTMALPQNLHAGQSVRVTAEYDGTRYLAQDVSPY